MINVDEHIRYAKMGGLTMMQIYFTAFIKASGCGYELKGDYEFNENYLRFRQVLYKQ